MVYHKQPIIIIIDYSSINLDCGSWTLTSLIIISSIKYLSQSCYMNFILRGRKYMHLKSVKYDAN